MVTLICPHCANPECEVDDFVCWNCGKELRNYCSNPECPQLPLMASSELEGVTLMSKHVYCPHCGSRSRFADLGFVQQSEF